MEILLSIVVLGGISLGAFYIYNDYRNSRQNNTQERPTNKVTQNNIPEPEPTLPDVDSMSKAQLLDYARELNLKVNVRNRKVDILDKIKTHLNNE